jgi:hypothetical protein
MSRFYQTARPVFVDNKIYQPPWELAQNVILANEQRVDAAFAEAQLANGDLGTIRHIDMESENQSVQAIQQKYGQRINEITEAMNGDVLNYQKYSQDLANLRRDFTNDRNSGDIFNIESRYAAYQQDILENEELKKTDPAAYNLVLNKRRRELEKALENDPKARYNAGQIYGKPDVTSEDNVKLFNAIKADLTSDFMRAPALNEDGTPKLDEQGNPIMEIVTDTEGNPMYKVNNKGVTEQEVQFIALSKMMGDPTLQAYSQQMAGFEGYEGYGEALVDKEGNINMKNPFGLEIAGVAQAYGFNESDFERTKGSLAYQEFGYDTRRSTQDFNEALHLQNLREARKDARIGMRAEAKAKASKTVDEKSENLILALPQDVITPEESSAMFETWSNLAQKREAGTLLPREKADLNRLSLAFEPLIAKDGDKILTSIGLDPDDYSDNRSKLNAFLRFKSQAEKLQSRISGEKRRNSSSPLAVGMPGSTYFRKESLADLSSSERDILERAKSLDEAFGDFDTYLAENATVTRLHMNLNPETDDGKRVLGILDQHMSVFDPSVTPGNLTRTDVTGRSRDNISVTVYDKYNPRSLGGKQVTNPLKRVIGLIDGVDNLTDLVEQGYIIPNVIPTDKGEISVLWTPTGKGEDIFQIDGSFRTTHSNIANEIFPVSTNPEQQALHIMANKGLEYSGIYNTISMLDNKMNSEQDYFEMYPEGKPFAVPHLQNSEVSYRYNPDGGFTLTSHNFMAPGNKSKYTVTAEDLQATAERIAESTGKSLTEIKLDKKSILTEILTNHIQHIDSFMEFDQIENTDEQQE